MENHTNFTNTHL